MAHAYKPLERQTGLYRYAGAFRQTDVVHVVLDLLEQSCFFEILGDGFTALEAVHAHIHAGHGCYGSVLVEDIDGLEIVGFAEHEVVFVVCRCDLETAGAELDVDIAVLDHGDSAAYERNNYLAAFKPLVLGVLGVDTHGGIAHYCFRTGGGDHGVVAALRIGVYHAALAFLDFSRFFCKIITQII